MKTFACTIIALASTLNAVEQDKRQHAAAGALIGSVIYGAARTTESRWASIAYGVVISSAAGAAKEWIHDRSRPESNTVDPRDFWWTAAGGVVGTTLACGADIAINGSSDSWSLSMAWRF